MHHVNDATMLMLAAVLFAALSRPMVAALLFVASAFLAMR